MHVTQNDEGQVLARNSMCPEQERAGKSRRPPASLRTSLSRTSRSASWLPCSAALFPSFLVSHAKPKYTWVDNPKEVDDARPPTGIINISLSPLLPSSSSSPFFSVTRSVLYALLAVIHFLQFRFCRFNQLIAWTTIQHAWIHPSNALCSPSFMPNPWLCCCCLIPALMYHLLLRQRKCPVSPYQHRLPVHSHVDQ